MTLLNQAVQLYDDNQSEALFKLATENWPLVGEELPTGIAEVCRYTFIRYAQAREIDQHLWRARALSAAVLTDARDTAAGLLLQAFFVVIDVAVKREQVGHEHGFEQARMILDEIQRLIPDGAPRSQLFARLFHEKRGYSFLMEGSGGRRPSPEGMNKLRAAETEYARALEIVESQRGTLKVRGNLALTRYLRLAEKPADEVAEAKKPFLAETLAIREAAAAAGYGDVENWASPNADVMERGEFVGWTPYEVQ